MISNQIEEEFNKAIAHELLIEIDPSITEERIAKIWDMCKGNPWNAPLILAILKAAGK